MTDYRTMFDASDWLFAFDLGGKDVNVTISRVSAGILTGTGGKTSKKPALEFVGKKKKLALNKTNGKTMVQLTGSRSVEDWVGVTVTLYPTTTTFGNDTVECIRIRNVLPTQPVKPTQATQAVKKDENL